MKSSVKEIRLQDSEVIDIFKSLSLSSEEIQLMKSKFVKLSLPKGTILQMAGEKVYYQYIIINGCLRTYYQDKSGKEYTLQFAIKDWWISDFTAFFTNSKAILNIDCIEDSTIYKISKCDMENLYENIPQLETFFRHKMERAFSSFQKRILGNLSQSAKERYLNFLSSYPTIEQKVKNYHIASYLGITTESLSRIRKELVNK